MEGQVNTLSWTTSKQFRYHPCLAALAQLTPSVSMCLFICYTLSFQLALIYSLLPLLNTLASYFCVCVWKKLKPKILRQRSLTSSDPCLGPTGWEGRGRSGREEKDVRLIGCWDSRFVFIRCLPNILNPSYQNIYSNTSLDWHHLFLF